MSFLKKIKGTYNLGKRIQNDEWHIRCANLINKEVLKQPSRTTIINFLLEYLNRDTTYLEIGVRFPEHNFNHIKAEVKYSVDPGFENPENPVDFKVTSDEFFGKLERGDVLQKTIRFDVIFIDGLHLAEQVGRDIINALKYIKDDGFIVLHDCNPPSEFNASETHAYKLSPAKGYWNGTTWKAFYHIRLKNDLYSCCIDTDWGIGIISKHIDLGKPSRVENPFFEYHILDLNRVECLNLLSFDKFKSLLKQDQS